MKFSNTNDGFTLVELAVVMIIIGILIGGVLKGQEMIQNARVAKTSSELQNFAAAQNTFFDSYNALPGDIAGLGRLADCTAANFCASGNNDGTVGSPIDNGTNNNAVELVESIQYWKHLAMAGIIGGVSLSASNAPVNSAWGQSHPATPVGGGYNAFETDLVDGLNDYGGRGVNIVITGIPNITDAAGGFLSPLEVSNIDLRLDDGLPNTGDIVICVNKVTCYSFV